MPTLKIAMPDQPPSDYGSANLLAALDRLGRFRAMAEDSRTQDSQPSRVERLAHRLALFGLAILACAVAIGFVEKALPLSSWLHRAATLGVVFSEGLVFLGVLLQFIALFVTLRSFWRDGHTRLRRRVDRDWEAARQLVDLDDAALRLIDKSLEQSAKRIEQRLAQFFGSPEKLALPGLAGAALLIGKEVLSFGPSIWLFGVALVLSPLVGLVLGGVVKRTELTGLAYQRDLIALVPLVRSLVNCGQCDTEGLSREADPHRVSETKETRHAAA